MTAKYQLDSKKADGSGILEEFPWKLCSEKQIASYNVNLFYYLPELIYKRIREISFLVSELVKTCGEQLIK